jgi:hypothetical protein
MTAHETLTSAAVRWDFVEVDASLALPYASLAMPKPVSTNRVTASVKTDVAVEWGFVVLNISRGELATTATHESDDDMLYGESVYSPEEAGRVNALVTKSTRLPGKVLSL